MAKLRIKRNNANAQDLLTIADRTEGPNTAERVTRPDMVLSLKDMIKRYTRGESLEGYGAAIYNGEIQYPAFEKLDEMDKIDILRQLDEEVAKEKRTMEQTRQRALKEREEQIRKQWEADQKELEELRKTRGKEKPEGQ